MFRKDPAAANNRECVYDIINSHGLNLEDELKCSRHSFDWSISMIKLNESFNYIK